MKNAQPLIPSGVNLTNKGGDFQEQNLNEKNEMIVGYYHIEAADMDEAVKIAKADPRFEDGQWSMEVRGIMKVDGIN